MVYLYNFIVFMPRHDLNPTRNISVDNFQQNPRMRVRV